MNIIGIAAAAYGQTRVGRSIFSFGTPLAIEKSSWLLRGEPGLGPAERGIVGAATEKRAAVKEN